VLASGLCRTTVGGLWILLRDERLWGLPASRQWPATAHPPTSVTTPVVPQEALTLLTFLREHDRLTRQCASEGVDHLRCLPPLTELGLIARVPGW
jgi:hypothetical protein